MKKESLLGLIFVIVGLLFSLYSVYLIFFSYPITQESVTFLVLGPCLMILGALFRYTYEVVKVERQIEQKEAKLSNWRVRDMEYRLRKLEREEHKERKETTEINEEEFEKFREIADKLLDDRGKEKIRGQGTVGDEEKKNFVLRVDKLLGELPPEKIENFVKDKVDYPVYQKVVRWAE